MLKTLLAGASALALLPAAALAQSTGSSVQFPAGYAPSTSVCVKQTDGTCVPVSAANPLPTAAAGSSRTAAGASDTTATPVQGVTGGVPVPVSGSVGLTGSLPAYAATPTFNIGTAPTLSVSDAGGSFTVDTGTPGTFAITAPLPAFAATPTFNFGTLNGAATAANQATMIANAPALATAGSAAPTTGTLFMGSDGTNGRPLFTDTTGKLYVSSNTVSGTTFTGGLFQIGGYASSTAPTAVTAGQRVNAWYGLNGQTVVSGAMNALSPGNVATGYNALQDSAGSGRPLGVFNQITDGTNIVSMRDATSANATTGTGLLGAGILGKYNATQPTYTDGQYGNVQMDAGGSVLVVNKTQGGALTDGISNTVLTLANKVGTTIGSLSFGLVSNGTTWDRARGDTNGAVNQPYAMASSRWTYAAPAGGLANTTTASTIMAAAGASVRNYLVSLQLEYDALTSATEIAVRDGAGGTVLWRGKLPSGTAGSRTIAFAIPLKGTANTLMEVATVTASGGGAVYANAQGFQGN